MYTENGTSTRKGLHTQDEQYVYQPVQRVATSCASHNPHKTVVYDLTVEDDHSFVVGLASVHNCWRIPNTRAVTVTNVIARGTLDEGLFALRRAKRLPRPSSPTATPTWAGC